MTFQELLNNYISRLDCSAKELACVSGLSPSLISRYRNGKLTPQADSEQLDRLSEGICTLAEKKRLSGFSRKELITEFQKSLRSDFDAEIYAAKINLIISELNINASSMAKSMGYDASFISRVRNGSRIPADLSAFTEQFIQYIVKNYDSPALYSLLKKQNIEGSVSDAGIPNLTKQLTFFLMKSSVGITQQNSQFIQKLEEFDLNTFIRSLQFAPATPDKKTASGPDGVKKSHENISEIKATEENRGLRKTYLGISGNKQSELDFFQYLAFSDEIKTVTMFDDIDMENLTDDMDFSKKWLILLASLLKRGVKFRIIHNLNRPFSELMLGLEAWIPLYMTGLVDPFYLKDTASGPYQHLLYCSDSCVLYGDYIKGHHDRAKFTLTAVSEEVDYYKERSRFIMDRALPLMKIYTANDTEQFRLFYQAEKTAAGKRHYMTSMLPVFALSDSFLSSVLQKQQFSKAEQRKLTESILRYKTDTEALLEGNPLLHEMPLISEEEFKAHPLMLDLTECGCPSPISIDYEDYLTYQKEVEQYAALHKSYTCAFNRHFPFRSIQIRILEGKWVWITKLQSPYIHFVIRHPKLRRALEQMCIPMYE